MTKKSIITPGQVLNLNYIEKRKWDNKMYFAPIKLEETLRNPAIIQNPYYE